MSADFGEPLGNAASGFGDLLGRLGIVATSARDEVEAVVGQLLASRGVDATFTELRWGHLVLTAGPQGAALLRMDSPKLLSELGARCPGEVSSLRIRVARQSAIAPRGSWRAQPV